MIKDLFTLRMPTRKQWTQSVILFCVYLVASLLGAHFFTPPAVVSATAGVALAGLVLGGMGLWPAIYLGALAGYFLNHIGSTIGPFAVVFLPVAQAAQAIVGALLLKKARFNPMLNRIRDGLMIFVIGVTSGVIVPAIGILAYSLDNYFFHAPIPALTFGSWWGGTVTSMVVLSPFLIRWLSRPFAKRSRKEVREIALAFGMFLVISVMLFFTSITQIGNISLVYFLLIPMFWIALRLGPRFMTLAIALIGAMGIASVYRTTAGIPVALIGERIFQIEMLVVVLAGIFLVIVTSEEEKKEALKNTRAYLVKLESDFGVIRFRDRTKDEFIAVLSHELRNPLAPLVSSIDLLRIKGLVSPEDTPILDDMEDRVRTIRRLLDDILDVSRISQNKFHLQKEYKDLQKIITRAVAAVEQKFEESSQIFTLTMRDEPIQMNIDAVRIEQVVTNLLNNASKFTQRGGHISLFVQQQGGMAEIRVKDDGIGIDPSMLDKVFEPFLQIDGRRRNDGLGIGLSVAKQLIEMHGGTIEARSQGNNRGSEFVVRLPLLPLAPPHDTSLPEDSSFNLLSKIEAGHRVLVVDDNSKAAHGIGKLLELIGYSVSYAYTGAEAIKLAETTPFDTIILDIGLPDMDGYEAARAIRTRLRFSGILIALTGYGQEEDKQKAYTAGFSHHLTKPIGIADLQTVLQSKAN